MLAEKSVLFPSVVYSKISRNHMRLAWFDFRDGLLWGLHCFEQQRCG